MELAKSYSEINTILDILGDDYKDKLPNKMVNMLDRASDKEYIPSITEDDFKNGRYSEETKSLLTVLYINYWTTETKKDEYMSLLKEKDQQYIVPKSVVVVHDIFAKPETKETESEFESSAKQEQSLIVVEEKGIMGKIKKIINKILEKVKK